MNRAHKCIWLLYATFTTVVLGLVSISPAQVILSENFSGTGLVDQSTWRLPFGGDGAFFGRTEVRTDLTTGYPSVSNGVATLELETFRDDGSGASTGLFLGGELHTKRNFARGGGLSFEVRARMPNPVPGLVGGIFLFDVNRTNAAGDLVRDEIDHELISNDTGQAFTNYWDDGSFFGSDAGGDGAQQVPFAGFDSTQFHDYRIDWLPNRVDWYVDNTLIRSITSNVPDDPMQLRLNLWAPDEGFTTAFSSSLQPAQTAAQNQTFGLEVDNVQVTRLNTALSDNLIVDSSFDDISVPFNLLNDGPVPDESVTGEWFGFNNVSFNSGVAARTGDTALQMFGPFNGNPDASGIWQNFDAAPGEEFEASVFAQTFSDDSIKGHENFANIRIDFLDANGDVIPGLGEFSGANAKENVILEGRDPNIPEDEWIERQVNALAPAGTETARVTLLFIQLDNDPGAVFFDDLSVVRLDAIAGISGDFDGNGIYDCADVDSLVAEIVGGANSAGFDLSGDGVVDDSDLDLWLAEAGAANLPGGGAFLDGDANLDGVVDVSDFNIWNANKFTNTAAWCSGDFSADGVVDVSDFNIWNGNKFNSSDSVAAVPEPSTSVMLLPVLVMGLLQLRRRA